MDDIKSSFFIFFDLPYSFIIKFNYIPPNSSHVEIYRLLKFTMLYDNVRFAFHACNKSAWCIKRSCVAHIFMDIFFSFSFFWFNDSHTHTHSPEYNLSYNNYDYVDIYYNSP